MNLGSVGENIGGRRMNRLKQMGLTPGHVDLVFFIATPAYNGLHIEIKVKGGRVSAEQKHIHKVLIDFGYKVAVCWSWDEAKEVTEEYLK